MVFDWDDFHQLNHRMDLLWRLKEAREDFKCTVFAVPGLGSNEFWSSIPDWIELAVHGWLHPHPYECSDWTAGRMERCLDSGIVQRWFCEGFKAPGWQISDDCYRVLLERGWWVADHPENNDRRPLRIRSHVWDGESHWHGHIQNVCDNGLEETFDSVLGLVRDAGSFEFMSEKVGLWTP